MSQNTTENLKFPSGRTIKRLKQDAKALAKCSEIPLYQALDDIAKTNGMACGWSQATYVLQNIRRKSMITKEEVEKAKKEVVLRGSGHHEHDDCIRIAYEWLDAQKKTKNIRNVPHNLKHLIERWAGRYVSQSDVEIAAHLHTEIFGDYPFYNLSSRLTEPSTDRLKNIEQAFTQGQRDTHNTEHYKVKE